MSKEHAYAYEAGYRDGSIHYELEHCPACKNVADLQEALADNAKLRELVKRMFDRVNYECHCCSIFCSDWDEDNECCVFTTLMRELGVDE